jgi:hypothetical protein
MDSRAVIGIHHLAFATRHGKADGEAFDGFGLQVNIGPRGGRILEQQSPFDDQAGL